MRDESVYEVSSAVKSEEIKYTNYRKKETKVNTESHQRKSLKEIK